MTKENKHLLEAFKNDFQSCLTNGAPHVPNHFQKTQQLWIEDDALRSSFLSNKDVKLVRKVVRNQYSQLRKRQPTRLQILLRCLNGLCYA